MFAKYAGLSLLLHAVLFGMLAFFRLPAVSEPVVSRVEWVELGEATEAPSSRPRAPAPRSAPSPPPETAGQGAPVAYAIDSISQNSAAPLPPEVAADPEGSPDARARRLNLEDFYAAAVRKELLMRKSYPAAARRLGQTGRVTLKFTISKEGQVINPALAEESKFPSLNHAARDLLAALPKFPPIPAELKRDHWDFLIPVEYKLE